MQPEIALQETLFQDKKWFLLPTLLVLLGQPLTAASFPVDFKELPES